MRLCVSGSGGRLAKELAGRDWEGVNRRKSVTWERSRGKGDTCDWREALQSGWRSGASEFARGVEAISEDRTRGNIYFLETLGQKKSGESMYL